MHQLQRQHRLIHIVALITGTVAALIGILTLLTPPTTAQVAGRGSPDGVWDEAPQLSSAQAAEQLAAFVEPPRLLRLSTAALAGQLASAPPEFSERPATLYLPLPDGDYELFHVYTTPLLAPELAAKHPQIRTYLAKGVTDPTRTGRLDWTPQGFHGMILGGDGRLFIDPLAGSDDLYTSYYAADFRSKRPVEFAPRPDFALVFSETQAEPESVLNFPLTSGNRYTYRLAVAATAEYTAYHDDGDDGNGDAKTDALSAIATTVNRVTAIYERDVAIRFQLVANNDQIILGEDDRGVDYPFTDLTTAITADPESVIESSDLADAHDFINEIIGAANFDVGHLVHALTAGVGGLAGQGVACSNPNKGYGISAVTTPAGDPFDVDFVAHEIGHQFDAHHTFNSNHANCTGGRNEDTAYEPGSGSTIMGYAGICGDQNLQQNSDAYFHKISIAEITNFITNGRGSACGQSDSTSNTLPTVDAGSSYTIPVNTPFVLSGTAVDAEQTALTYAWEQFTLGPGVSPLATPSPGFGDYPIFRSFSPVLTGTRYFPQLSDLVENTSTIGEMMPAYARTITFALTVRDGAAPAGGVAYDLTTVEVVDSAGPFRVTEPNTAVLWLNGSDETITWDVANTTGAPVNCTAVDILLSTDRGYTYPHTLRSNTPNDGTETVSVPDFNTSSARIQVRCRDNIFFDISNVDFLIADGANNAILLPTATPATSDLTTPDTLTYTITISNLGGIAASATITDIFPAPLANPVCNGQSGDLQESVNIPAEDGTNFTCTMDAPNLLQMDVSVDETTVFAGEAVTYTAMITNTSAQITLSDVAVSLPGVANCTPALPSVNTLEPAQTITFNCPNNVINAGTTVNGSSSAQTTISNSVTAAAAEDPRGPQTSIPRETLLRYAATDAVTVSVQDQALLEPEISGSATLRTPGTLTYTINVSNSGTINADTTITGDFDAALTSLECLNATLPRTVDIAQGSSDAFSCRLTAPNYLEFSLLPAAPIVPAGEAVTYTLQLTNTSSSETLQNVAWEGPFSGCAPALASITSIAPEEVKTIICPNQPSSDGQMVTASVSAQLTAVSTVTATADEDPRGPQTSPAAETTLTYAAEETAVVTWDDWLLFLPQLQKSLTP